MTDPHPTVVSVNDLAHLSEKLRDQEPSSISGGGETSPVLLSRWEQKAVLGDLMGIECLINYHDCQEAGAEAVEWGCGAGNARRALELLALGREIIARDPDLWTDEQKEPFKVRFSERASLTNPTEVSP